MRTRRWAPIAVLVVVAMGFGPMAAAQVTEQPVEFVTSSTGSRTVTLATAPEFPDQDLSLVSGDVTSLAGTTTLTETFASGASWSVSAELCGPDSYASPTTADCTTYPNQLVRAAGTAAADRLEGSTISVARTAIVNLGVPVHTVTAGSETDMSAPIVLMTSSDELPSSVYNGAYTTTTTLTINDLIRNGTWKGYWVITQTT